jgi:hypothetical protein
MKLPGLGARRDRCAAQLARITRGSAGVPVIATPGSPAPPTMLIAWVDDRGPGDSMGAPLDAPAIHRD